MRAKVAKALRRGLAAQGFHQARQHFIRNHVCVAGCENFRHVRRPGDLIEADDARRTYQELKRMHHER